MARNKDSAEIVAVKVIRKRHLLAQGADGPACHLGEGGAADLAAERHPYIVCLHASFQDDAHLYLVMDFVGGGDLFALIESKRRLPEAWARIYSAEVGLALEHVHSKGIIYRDLKPENVMVGVDGHLKITDFGFAKKLQDADGKPALNTRGSTVGTPEYMAPELVTGQPYAFALDWWCLGCLTYEMMTGRGRSRRTTCRRWCG